MSPLAKKKAIENTAHWCLDRCIRLGHCEALADLSKMTEAQVQSFCRECVTGDSDESVISSCNPLTFSPRCDISFMFEEEAPWKDIPPPPELQLSHTEKK